MELPRENLHVSPAISTWFVSHVTPVGFAPTPVHTQLVINTCSCEMRMIYLINDVLLKQYVQVDFAKAYSLLV